MSTVSDRRAARVLRLLMAVAVLVAIALFAIFCSTVGGVVDRAARQRSEAAAIRLVVERAAAAAPLRRVAVITGAAR